MAAEYLARMGERIRARRLELHLTQQQVANRLPGEVSNARVSLWERGKNRPRDDYLEKLAEILEVDVAYFMAAEPEKGATPDPLDYGPMADESVSERLDRLEEKVDEVGQTLARVLALNERVLAKLLANQELIIRLLGGGDGGAAQDVEQPQDPRFPGDQRSDDSDERADEG